MTAGTHVYNPTPSRIRIGAMLAEHDHWLLRAAFAGVFAFHGVTKFALMGIGGFAGMMGLPWSVALLVALAEVLAGVGILAGGALRGGAGDLVTRLSGLAALPVLLGAIVLVHWGRWSFTPSEAHPMGGMEFQVVLLLLAAFFAIRGNEA